MNKQKLRKCSENGTEKFTDQAAFLFIFLFYRLNNMKKQINGYTEY